MFLLGVAKREMSVYFYRQTTWHTGFLVSFLWDAIVALDGFLSYLYLSVIGSDMMKSHSSRICCTCYPGCCRRRRTIVERKLRRSRKNGAQKHRTIYSDRFVIRHKSKLNGQFRECCNLPLIIAKFTVRIFELSIIRAPNQSEFLFPVSIDC